MSTAFRPGFLLYLVGFFAVRMVLSATTDLTWLPSVAISAAVAVVVAVAGEAIYDRLRPAADQP